MIKTSVFLLIIFSLGFSQTTLYGLDGWYHIGTLATAGGAGAVPSSDSDRINPAGLATLPKQIQFNIIKYPAGINTQSAIFVKKLNNSNIGIGLRHLNYGNFISTNEDGVEGGTYSAGDTWLSTAWARNNKNINWGASGGIFLSSLESYNATALVFSTGAIYNYSKYDIQVGISLSNFGFFVSRYTEQKEKLPTNIILSANKGLTHLPLDLNVDIGFDTHTKTSYLRVGGIFELPYNLQLSVGVNSNNVTQRTEANLAKSILGSSGIGIAYRHNKYSIELGGYSYGVGGWIYGTGFNIKL
ncbi:MAG: hypothetical protein MUP82_09140 [Candidatus Marinimicrobia bacterium]|nr:hypothetical protein [Candidatus Neomarinimicrobiota bacterium]